MTGDAPADAVVTLALGAELIVFLVVLLRGLSKIREHLEKTEGVLSHVQWGVRAIETQTAPLGERLPTMVRLTREVSVYADALATRLASSGGRADVLSEPADRV